MVNCMVPQRIISYDGKEMKQKSPYYCFHLMCPVPKLVKTYRQSIAATSIGEIGVHCYGMHLSNGCSTLYMFANHITFQNTSAMSAECVANALSSMGRFLCI
jgi:hypothetical protein